MCFGTDHRFHDAGYYFWKLSVQCLDLVSGGASSGNSKSKTKELTIQNLKEHKTGAKRGKTCNQCQARENLVSQITSDLYFHSDWPQRANLCSNWFKSFSAANAKTNSYYKIHNSYFQTGKTLANCCDDGKFI